jgi:hypothetical protein
MKPFEKFCLERQPHALHRHPVEGRPHAPHRQHVEESGLEHRVADHVEQQPHALHH